MNIGISGASGKMGKELISSAKDLNMNVSGKLSGYNFITEAKTVVSECDVLLDFSVHTSTAVLAALCEEWKKPLVIGTTGHFELEIVSIKRSAERIPIVLSSNFSSGVNVLFWLTQRAAEILGSGFDREIVEVHHRLKKDAPSGTAHTLAKILADVRGQRLDEVVESGRAGIVGPRSPEKIGIHSVRGGDVVGEHVVVFAGAGERVELVHKASSRKTFAEGALRAAAWIIGKQPGLYSMQDVLGLR